MKDILIITYYWPPSAGAGVQRWLKFSKYLPKYGYRPVIFTPENPHYNLKDEKLEEEIHPATKVIKQKIWEPYGVARSLSRQADNTGMVKQQNQQSLIARIINFVRANVFVPDPRIFWIKPSYNTLKKIVKKENIEYLVTTGPPHSMHLIGLKLKQKFPKLKWVVDIRDPWSKFDYLKQFKALESRQQKNAALESKVLELADIVLATSFSMKDLLVPFDHGKFVTITNGFDKEDFKNYADLRNRSTIRIYHGGLLNQLRNPTHLWEALEQICIEDNVLASRLSVHMTGIIDRSVVQEISSYNKLKDKLEIESYKSHAEIIKDYGRADILLLLVNNSDNAAANIPGKLFEYLATGKKIIIFCSNDADALQILKERGNYLHYNFDKPIRDLDALKQFITEDYTFAESDTLSLRYERTELTKNLVRELDAL